MSFDGQTIGIFTTDASLVIRSWDNWLVQSVGIPAEEARGKSLFDLFPELETRGLKTRFERVLMDGTVEVLSTAFHRYLIPCPPGKPSNRFDKMQQNVTIAPLRENETIIGTIVTIEDVTARLDRELEVAVQLASPEEGERVRATQILADEDLPSSAEHLAQSIGDESWRVRKNAVDGLIRKAGAGEIDFLLRALRDDHRNPGVLNSALQVLALGGIDAIESLTRFLEDPDHDLRIYAAQALGDQHDPRAIPMLQRTLEDENLNVRYHAIEALGKLRAAEAVDQLAEIAASREFFLAFAALDALTAIGDPRVAPRLVALLEDELLCSSAADALGRLGDEEIIAPLVTLLNKPDAPTQVIVSALAALYDRYENSYGEGSYIADLMRAAVSPTGVQNVLNAIDQASGEALRAFAIVLGWLEGEAVEPALIRLLGQNKARREIIEALVRYGGRATKLLIEQLRSDDSETRKAVLMALGRIGDASAVAAIIDLLGEENELTIAAAGALGKIGDRRAFEALLELIGSDNAAVRQAAIAAINSLGHPDTANRARQLLTDKNSNIRESAVKIAGYFGFAECTEILLERCHDEVESVRRAALENLPYLEDDRVLPTLAEAIENGSPSARAAAATAFAQMEPAEALPYLFKAITDEDAWVRYFAVRSIGRHRYRESFATLAKLATDDPANHVRIAAIDSLGEIDSPEVIAVLTSVMESAEVNLAQAAIKALGKIHHPDALPPLLTAMRSSDVGMRLGALQALGRRGGEEAIQALRWTAASCSDASVTQTAIEALAQQATEEAIAALIDLTAEAGCRELSVTALSHLREQKIDIIGEGLAHAQTSVRRAVVDALGRMKHPRASAVLSQGLEDPDASVRLAAANALGYLGNHTAERKLLVLVRSDPDAAVRRAAQKALRK